MSAPQGGDLEQVREYVARITFAHPDDESHTFAVHVEYREPGRYAVVHLGSVLNQDGEWEREPMPSSRSDEFRARTRYDVETARRLAREQAGRLLPDYRAQYARTRDAERREAPA